MVRLNWEHAIGESVARSLERLRTSVRRVAGRIQLDCGRDKDNSFELCASYLCRGVDLQLESSLRSKTGDKFLIARIRFYESIHF
jgi:hypothetical protein